MEPDKSSAPSHASQSGGSTDSTAIKRPSSSLSDGAKLRARRRRLSVRQSRGETEWGFYELIPASVHEFGT